MKRKTPQKKNAKSKAVVVTETAPSVDVLEIPEIISTDPRKALFLRLYFDRESPTWGNAKQSAIRAGFSAEYADCITYQKPKWFAEFLEQQDFVELAEGHLREVLQLPNVAQAMGAFGPIFRKIPTGKFEYKKIKGKRKRVEIVIEEPVYVPQPSVIKVKNEAAKIVLPAYDPRYKPKDGPKNAFFFNVQAARERYNGNKNARVSKNN